MWLHWAGYWRNLVVFSGTCVTSSQLKKPGICSIFSCLINYLVKNLYSVFSQGCVPRWCPLTKRHQCCSVCTRAVILALPLSQFSTTWNLASNLTVSPVPKKILSICSPLSESQIYDHSVSVTSDAKVVRSLLALMVSFEKYQMIKMKLLVISRELEIQMSQQKEISWW